MKKIGIITFHNSYNCGSMLESYAIQTIINRACGNAEIIDFSNDGQRDVYSVFFKNSSAKNIIKNLILLSHKKKIEFNNMKYEQFKDKNFILSDKYTDNTQLNDNNYSVVVAGSDQIWNITISDGDDAYFLPWVKRAKKVAYAPSFGAKKIVENTTVVEKYKNMINQFDALSIREENGRKWIKELCNKDVDVLLDPTLLLDKKDYEKIEDKSINPKEKYIFFYAPSFDRKICKYVKRISEKYDLKVITWSTKSYYLKFIKSFGFVLPEYEDPSVYLSLIKNAELVITTSYHGTIFSTIYKKKFIVVKNGGMYGNDDRVRTLLEQINMEDRLLSYEFKPEEDYLRPVNYENYDEKIKVLKLKSIKYIRENICLDKGEI